MARERNPNRDKAFQIWLEHNGNITNRAIAEMLGEKEKTISVWKLRDKWNVVLQKDECSTTNEVKPKRGAPKGNKNALGNDGGAPLRNDNAVTHGLFRKYLPQDEEYLEIFDAAGETHPLDMLWSQIQIKFANIIHAQRIMFVESKDEIIKELKKRKRQMDTEKVGKNEDGASKYETYEAYIEEEWEFQFAWDRQATALNSLSRAMSSLTSMIRQYEELSKNYGDDEERSLRIEKMKAEIENLKGGGKGEEAENWTAAIEAIAKRRQMKVNSDE